MVRSSSLLLSKIPCVLNCIFFHNRKGHEGCANHRTNRSATQWNSRRRHHLYCIFLLSLESHQALLEKLNAQSKKTINQFFIKNNLKFLRLGKVLFGWMDLTKVVYVLSNLTIVQFEFTLFDIT